MDRDEIRIVFSRRQLKAGLALGCLLSLAYALKSVETMRLSTYYPAPAGVYKKIITTAQTILARDGGPVGIGTSTPQGKLDVVGTDMWFASGQAGSGALRLVPYQTAPGGTSDVYFELYNKARTGSGNMFHFSGMEGANPLMTLDIASQRVGIGTNVPRAMLEVKGSILQTKTGGYVGYAGGFWRSSGGSDFPGFDRSQWSTDATLRTAYPDLYSFGGADNALILSGQAGGVTGSSTGYDDSQPSTVMAMGDLEVRRAGSSPGKIHANGDICTDAGGGKCLSTAGGGGGGGLLAGPVRIVSKPMVNRPGYWARVKCADDEIVTGGGTSGGDAASSYPLSIREWNCYSLLPGYTCYGVCLKLQSP